VTTRDVGDRINLRHLVYSAAGALTNATVTLTVVDPAGGTSTPTVTNSATGTYDAAVTLASAGLWTWRWTVSGAVIEVEDGSILAVDPAPPTYASLQDLKTYLRITDTTDDALLQSALDSSSRQIEEQHCNRVFYPSTTATARTYYPRDAYNVVVDDFWTTTGLIVAIDTADNGSYSTVLTLTTDYIVKPTNPRVGWPQNQIMSVNLSLPFLASRRPSVQVTAKWGWPAVPDLVRRACIQLAEEDFKMKGAPFGVAGVDQFGPIRVRENRMALAWLAPYRRDPILIK